MQKKNLLMPAIYIYILLIAALLILMLLISSCAVNWFSAQTKECANFERQLEKDNCLMELGKNKTDLSICNQIKDEQLKDGCYSEVGIAKNDYKICDKFKSEYCYAAIAINNQDIGFCATGLKTYYWKDICFNKIAVEKKSESLCAMVRSQETRDQCYFNIAVNKNDSKICPNLVNIDNRDKCFMQIALAKLDFTICQSISNTINSDGNCLFKISRLKNDTSICSRIGALTIKRSCYNI